MTDAQSGLEGIGVSHFSPSFLGLPFSLLCVPDLLLCLEHGFPEDEDPIIKYLVFIEHLIRNTVKECINHRD